jgi:membrane protein involved in colicin uptake
VNTFSNELSNAVLRARNPSYSGGFYSSTTQRKEQDMGKSVAEHEAAARAEAEAKAKAEAEAKAKQEAEAKAQVEAAAAAKQEVAKLEADTSRGRIKAILECDEAKGREPLARHLALETDTSAEQARAILAKTPKASRLDEAMAGLAPGVASQETPSGLPKVNLDPAAIYARRAEQYSKGAPK